MDTAMNWIIYEVIEEGCGEPDTNIGYFQTEASAIAAVTKHNGSKSKGHGFCSHGGGQAKYYEIEVKP